MVVLSGFFFYIKSKYEHVIINIDSYGDRWKFAKAKTVAAGIRRLTYELEIERLRTIPKFCFVPYIR